MNITLVTSGSKARSTPACVITRGMTQAITATLLTEGGANVSTTGVAAWELGITQDFLAATGLLAATAAIEAAGNVLTIALNGHTTEMAEYLDGKKTAAGFATLKGFDSHGVTIASYVWQVVLQNVGYDADTEAAHAIDGLFYTAAVVDAKFAAVGDAIPAATEGARGTIALATAAEAAAGVDAGKAITAATLKPLLDAKVDVVAGKGLSTNDYDNTDAAKVATINNATLAALSGADVSVAPWTQSKWDASGTCSLTASGWAASGHQVAYIVITLAAGATTSIIGTEEVAEEDALSAAGVYECYIKNVDGKKYFRVISFTEAAS